MIAVKYGDWKIAVDVDKTKLYYSTYEKNDNQANRNFAKYCESMTVEETAFFDAFGIDPTCCEIEHIGADKKGNFPCGGYYLICGKYLEYPPEELITPAELAENDFVDDRSDNCVYIGGFQFNFQCEYYATYELFEDIPAGFIRINFWCEEMKWLLPEKPEEMMYELPRFWEIHKIIKERINSRKQMSLDLDETKAEFIRFFESLSIKAPPLNKKEIKRYKKEWINNFSPADVNIKHVRKICLKSRKFTPFLWHIFSFGFLNCETEEKANVLFDQQDKSYCVILSNVDDIAFKLKNSVNLKAELLNQFIDVTVTSDDFAWTYIKTHEGTCGPYFYRK